ncbi:MAG: hypothetical protein AB7P49_20630 [Bdellovibrionales bacterium]
MNKSVRFEVTDELALKSLGNEMGFRNFRSLFGMYLVIAFVIVLVLSAFGSTPRNIGFIILAILGVLFCSYYWFGYYQIRRNLLLKLGDVPDRWKTFTFNDHFFQVKDIHGILKFPWKKLEGMVKYKDFWHFHFEEVNIRVPVFLMDQELETFIEKKAKEQKAKISYGGGYRQ